MSQKPKDLKVSEEDLDSLGKTASLLSSTVIIIKNFFPQLLSSINPELLAGALSNIYFLNFALFGWHGYKACNATGNRRTNEAEKAFLQLVMGTIAIVGLTGGWGAVAIAAIALATICYYYLSKNENFSFTNNVLRSQYDHNKKLTKNGRQAGSKIVPVMQQF